MAAIGTMLEITNCGLHIPGVISDFYCFELEAFTFLSLLFSFKIFPLIFPFCAMQCFCLSSGNPCEQQGP